MRIFAATALGLVLASPTLAQTLPMGCFARDYDAAHLAANPQQNVQSIRLNFVPEHEFGSNVMAVRVLLANQARAADEGFGGQVMEQLSYCWDDGGTLRCGVECDAGIMDIGTVVGDRLDVTTSNFWVGDVEGCGGAMDLAEIDGQSTTYRVFRADGAQCEGM